MDAKSENALFYALELHELHPPKPIVGAFHLLLAMQWIGYALNEQIPWPLPIKDIRCAFAVTHLPVWDQNAVCMPYNEQVFKIMHYVFTGLSITCFLTLVACVTLKTFMNQNLLRFIAGFNRFLLLALAEPFFVPAVRILIQGNPDRLGWPVFLVGCVALAALLFVTVVQRAMLLDPTPTGQSWSARAHGRSHIALSVMQVGAGFALGLAPRVLAQLLVAGVSFVTGLLFWFTQPYYAHGVNVFYVSFLLLGTFTGVLAAIVGTASPGDSSVESGAPAALSMMAAWGGPLVLVFGYLLVKWRFLPKTAVVLDDFPQVVQYPFGKKGMKEKEPISEHRRYAPETTEHDNEDEDEDVFHHDDLRLTEASDDDASSIRSDGPNRRRASAAPSTKATREIVSTAVRLPLIFDSDSNAVLNGDLRSVSFSFEVELFLRFLYNLDPNLPDEYRHSLMDYGEQVFAHAFNRFPQNGLIIHHYILFLGFCVEDLPQTFAHLKAIRHRVVPIDVKYFAYRIESKLANTLQLEDLMTQTQIKAARRHHRAILVQLVQLWTALNTKAPDIMRLDSITRRLHKQRTSALKAFQALLSDSNVNPTVFRHWGLFVETVLLDSGMANEIYVQSKVLESKSRAKNDKRAKRSKKGDDEEGLMSEHVTPFEIVRQKEAGYNNTNILKLVRNMKIGFGVLIVLLSVSCVVFFMFSEDLEKIVKQSFHGAQIRTKTQQASAWVKSLDFPTISSRIGVAPTMNNVARDVFSSHNRLTAGDLGTFGSHLEYFHYPRVPVVHYFGNLTVHKERDVINVWDIGFDLAYQLRESARTINNTVASPSTRFILQNGPTTVAHTWNLSMQFYVEDAAKEAQSHFYVQSALAMIALTVALVIYLMHKWSFKVWSRLPLRYV